MPPKKAASSTKEKAPAKKSKTLKEKQVSEDKSEEAPKKKPRAATAKSSDSSAAKPAKKRAAKTKEDPPESENGVESQKSKPTKTVKAKPKKPAKSEDPGTSKTGTTRGTRARKEDPEKKDEESGSSSDSPPKKATKRKAKKADSGESEPSVEEKRSKPAPSRANPTTTNWAAVDFSCTAKSPSGKPPNYKIVSWNVDGMRAWIRKGGLDLLQHAQPDILCVQETKCSKEKIPEEMNGIEGYESFWCCSEREGYAGVGTLTRSKPLNVIYGIESEEHDDEGRCVTVEMEAFFLVNVYVPNAGRKLVTLPKRLEWNVAFKAFVKRLDEKKPVIVCGDMNVAHQEIDLANPKTNTKNAGFTAEEREGMTDFLQDGYIDTFRELYPERQAFTFWTYMLNARSKNIGWRLDYFIISERFKENVCDNVILHEVFGSDHCPIALHVYV